MKKSFIALFALVPVLCLGDYTDFNSNAQCRFYAYRANSSGGFPFSTAIQSKVTPASEIFYASLSVPFGICFSSSGALVHPKQSIIVSTPTNKTVSVDYPIFSVSDSSYYSLEFACPQLYSLLSLAAHVYADGNHLSSLKVVYYTDTNTYVNFTPTDFISELITSTNTIYRSSVIRCLSTLPDINSSLSSIDRNLIILANRPTSDFDISTLSNRLIAAQNLGLQNEMSVDVDTALDNLNFSTYDTSQPEFAGIYDSIARSYDRALNTIETLSGLSAISVDPSGRSKLNDLLKQFGNSFSAAGAVHFTTPLTNEMQRMSTNWVQETKAALSNNTQKIKDDLQAWKDMLSGPNGSQAAIVSALNGAMNNTGAFKVELQNANNSVYVHLDGPITLNSAQFQDVNNKLQANFDIFHDWIYAIPESWVRYFYMFRENSTAVLTNQFEQISLLSSLTNLLFEYSLNFTSNTMFAISNSFAGLSFTNQYLLLSDYQTFVDSSKYNDIISSLPPDLSSALSSYGFSDSSDYSGRWWAFITANSAYQSTLLSTNAALASTLLSALEQIDDDQEGSLLSRWLSLIRSLPDPEELQIMIADASNIVSNVGFDRVDSFYNTVTSDFANVTKNVFRDKALPSVLSFTYLPAIDGRDAKIVEIPVGEHSSLWSLFRRGMAFAVSVVTLILFPKYLSWLLTHYISLVQRVIRSLHSYTHT